MMGEHLKSEVFGRDVSRIMAYVGDCLEKYRDPDIELLEVIVTPETPFFIVAKVTVKSVGSPFAPELDRVENETAFLEAKGIRLVARGNYESIPEHSEIAPEELAAVRGVLDTSPTEEDGKGLAEFPVFGDEIARIRRHVLSAVEPVCPNVWLWEIEIQADKLLPVLARIVSRDEKGYGPVVSPEMKAREADFRDLGFVPELLKDNDSYKRSFAFDRWARRMRIGSHRAYALKLRLGSACESE